MSHRKGFANMETNVFRKAYITVLLRFLWLGFCLDWVEW